MKLILKIAAGVVIGSLLLQIILMKMYPPDLYEKMNEELKEVSTLKNKFIRLQTAIHNYYQQNKVLPKSVSAISCTKILGENYGGRDIKMTEVPCAETMVNGEFFVNYNNQWASVEPYVVNNKVRFTCTTTVEFAHDDRYSHCKVVDADDVIERVAEMSAEAVTVEEDAADITDTAPVVRAEFPSNIAGRWVGGFLPSDAIKLSGGERVNELVLHIQSGMAKVIANTTSGGEYVIGNSIQVHQYDKSFSLTAYSGPGDVSEVWSISVADVGDVDLGVSVTVIRHIGGDGENVRVVERMRGVISREI